jgi:hypothetical protein
MNMEKYKMKFYLQELVKELKEKKKKETQKVEKSKHSLKQHLCNKRCVCVAIDTSQAPFQAVVA